MNPTYYLAPIFTLIAAYVVSFLIRSFLRNRQIRHAYQEKLRDRDRLIATIRLRLPPKAEFVTLEHQMYFMDERNRAAASDVFIKNGFEVATSETYEKRTRY